MPDQLTINTDRPNLFHYATSELSQDAFICWLAAWADPKWEEGEDSAIHQTAQAFVVSMIHKKELDYTSSLLRTVDVKRQVDKLDILIEVNKGMETQLAILIEDKTHTSNHSDQLNRYYKQIQSYGYAESQMIPIYFKTGYQSRFDALGFFSTYLRKDFLEVLRNGKINGIKNAIYDDFLAHLERMDFVIKQFSTKELGSWVDNDWIGFFTILYENRYKLYDSLGEDGANWNYVANPTGGFYGFWWYFKNLSDKRFTPYLQLEEDKLCFKIMVDAETHRGNARDEAHKKIQEAASRLGIDVVRPDRMGNGKFMTVARWKDDEYRVFNNRTLDMEATLENLKKAQAVLDLAFPG